MLKIPQLQHLPRVRDPKYKLDEALAQNSELGRFGRVHRPGNSSDPNDHYFRFGSTNDVMELSSASFDCETVTGLNHVD